MIKIYEADIDRIEGRNRQFYSNSWGLQYLILNSVQNNQTKDNYRNKDLDFPGNVAIKNPPVNAGDIGSIPSLGRFHKLLQGN